MTAKTLFLTALLCLCTYQQSTLDPIIITLPGDIYEVTLTAGQ